MGWPSYIESIEAIRCDLEHLLGRPDEPGALASEAAPAVLAAAERALSRIWEILEVATDQAWRLQPTSCNCGHARRCWSSSDPPISGGLTSCAGKRWSGRWRLSVGAMPISKRRDGALMTDGLCPHADVRGCNRPCGNSGAYARYA